jgi:hypothetical protein
MQPGDTISASIIQTQLSPPTYAINGVWKGQTADLAVDVGTENFVLTYVALETYYVAACDQFLTGQFVFNGLYMANVNNQMLTPTWGVEPANGTSCCHRDGAALHRLRSARMAVRAGAFALRAVVVGGHAAAG